MTSKKTRIFKIEDVDYQFDFQSFKIYVDGYVKRYKDKGANIKKAKVFEYIVEKANVTPEAVKQWYYGNNGPSDLAIIQKAAEVLEITDYLNLMRVANKGEKMLLNSLQMESLKRIYDDIIEYLEDFYQTDGFTGALWYEFERRGSKDPEDDIYEYAEDRWGKVLLRIKKEYFYLHNADVYGDILEYSENDLLDIFDGKLGYAYRFEAYPEDNPTTEDDYNKALKRLNEIVEKYI